MNRILFLWLDFLSISRCLFSFYVFFYNGRNFWFLLLNCLSFGELEGDIFALDHGIPHIPMFRWADWCWFVGIGIVRIEQMWAVCWIFSSSFFFLFRAKRQFFTVAWPLHNVMYLFVRSFVRSLLIDGQMFIYIRNIGGYSSNFCPFRWQ